MSIALRGVSKQFGEYPAVENIDLDVATGALMALLGPSGSGKTTLLRIIGGLETPDEGQVLFDGQGATLWPIGDRQVGLPSLGILWGLCLDRIAVVQIIFNGDHLCQSRRPAGVISIEMRDQNVVDLLQACHLRNLKNSLGVAIVG